MSRRGRGAPFPFPIYQRFQALIFFLLSPSCDSRPHSTSYILVYFDTRKIFFLFKKNHQGFLDSFNNFEMWHNSFSCQIQGTLQQGLYVVQASTHMERSLGRSACNQPYQFQAKQLYSLRQAMVGILPVLIS